MRSRKGPEPFLYLPREESRVNETTQRAVKTAWTPSAQMNGVSDAETVENVDGDVGVFGTV